MLSNFSTLLLGLGGFLRPSHKHARTLTLILEPSCTTDRWRNTTELVHLGTAVPRWKQQQQAWPSVAELHAAFWLQRMMDRTSETGCIHFYQGCLETVALCPITYLTLINRTLVHFCMICCSPSEYTHAARLQPCFSPLRKTSAGKLCIAEVPGRKRGKSRVTQSHQARECSSLSGLALFVWLVGCFCFSIGFPPPHHPFISRWQTVFSSPLKCCALLHLICIQSSCSQMLIGGMTDTAAYRQRFESEILPSLLYRKQFFHVWMAFF